MKPETSAKLHKACADLAKEITPHLSGFAPYTPVTVSSHTFPYQETGRDGGSVGNPAEGSTLEPRESDRQAHEHRLRELSEPPYGTKITINQEPLDYWQTPSK